MKNLAMTYRNPYELILVEYIQHFGFTLRFLS